MNYVKKLLISKDKKYFFIKLCILLSIVFFCIIIILLLSLSRNKEKYLFLTYPHDYHVILNETTELSTTIMSNQLDSIYLQPTSIEQIVLYDSDTQDQFIVKLNKIDYLNESIIYENDKYYQYKITINLPIDNTSLIMNKAYLSMNYLTGDKLDFYIGKIWIHEIDFNKDLLISRMHGIINEINGNPLLVGIVLKGTNLANKIMNITKIDILSDNIKPSYPNILTIDYDVDYHTSIKTIIGNDYEIEYQQNQINDKLNIIFNEQTENTILIPLTYVNIKTINKLGLIITYEIEGIVKQQFIEPFTFYQIANQTYEVMKIVFTPI